MKTKIQLTLIAMLLIMANSACERMDSPKDKDGTRLNINLNAGEIQMVEKGNNFSNNLLANTYLKIEEEGIKAVTISSDGAGIGAPPVLVEKAKMDINRPFVFAIRENSTKAILFTGKIAHIQ